MINRCVLPLGAYEANCSILWSDPDHAWIVDPGDDMDSIEDCLNVHHLTPGIIVLTHGHFDHISAVNDVLKRYPGLPIYLHAADVPLAFSPFNAMPPYSVTQRPATLDTSKCDGDTLSYGGLTAQIIHTPGHTPGSCCLYFEKEHLLVAGDMLFLGSIGRTDFPGGNIHAMQQSIERLKQLPDPVDVITGHGPLTTLGNEKRSNPYF